MGIFDFVVTVILVTVSGALAPGPLFFTVVSHGMKSGAKGGLIFSIGHTIFESALVLSLALILNFGVKPAAGETQMQLYIGMLGGIALIIFGALQIYEAFKTKRNNSQKETATKTQKFRHPLILGLAFTGLNPFFIIWWLTVGLALIEQALALASFAGVIIMYLAHVWMDYAWLVSTAYLAKKGANIVSSKGYRILVAVFGVVLVYFGANFIISAVT